MVPLKYCTDETVAIEAKLVPRDYPIERLEDDGELTETRNGAGAPDAS